MAVTINEDVKVGNATFHVQTEFYRSSGKVVCNIFKDGASIKRFERELKGDEDPEVLVKNLHRQVIERLTQSREEIRQSGKLNLSEETVGRVIETVSPYFGVASYLILEDALSKAASIGDFVERIVEDLDSESRSTLKRKLAELLSNEGVKSSTGRGFEGEFKFTEELRNQVLEILKDYFGIMASSVLEEAEKNCKTYEELVDRLVSSLDGKEREELETRLMFLRT